MSSTVIPGLRYKDAPAMIDWLEQAFGFKRHLVVEDENGGITHAQLTLGTGMIMLGSTRDDHLKNWKPPREVGYSTQIAYVVVSDPDAVYERAKAAGARIILEISDKPYGGRDFTCEDPEGHIWSIGSYNPWQNSENG